MFLSLSLIVLFGLGACSGGDETSMATEGGGSGAGSGISTGGAQDFAFFRQILEAGDIPRSTDIDDQGFFAEHASSLGAPDCGELICPQVMLGVMGNLINGADCTVLQIGMNTPLNADDLPRLPLNLAVVVDVSGSMAAENKIEYVQFGLNRMLDSLQDDDRISIITYSDAATTVLESTVVRDNRFVIREVIDAFVANGGTNLYAGLEAGYLEVMSGLMSEQQNRVILLSDGQPTVGNTSAALIISMSNGYNSEGVGLTTVGVGFAFNETLMRELAEEGNGNFYFVDGEEAAVEVFIEEVEFFTTAIAEDLVLTLHPGSGYRIRGVFGTNQWEPEGDGGTIRIPAVFLAHRQAHDDNDRGRRGGGSAILIELMAREGVETSEELADIGKLTLSYVPLIDPETWGREPITIAADVWYPEEEQGAETGFFSSQAILKNFVMLNILAGFRLASDQFHGGLPEVALGTIEGLAANVESLNLELEDEDIEDDLRLLRLFAANLTARGAGAPEPSTDDPWPQD